MAEPKRERMRLKISKLLALAASPGATADEADTFTTRAFELMAKFRIDEAEVRDAGGWSKSRRIGQRTIMIPRDDLSVARAVLVEVVAQAAGGTSMRQAADWQTFAVEVFAPERDLDLIELQYTSLAMQAARRLPEIPPAGRESWFYGWVASIDGRMKAAAEQAASGPEGARAANLLPMLRSDLAESTSAMREAYPALQDGDGVDRRRIKGDWLAAGIDEGERVDLDQHRRVQGGTAGHELPSRSDL